MKLFDKFRKKPPLLIEPWEEEHPFHPARKSRRVSKSILRIIREFETHIILLLLCGFSFMLFFASAKMASLGFWGMLCAVTEKCCHLREIFEGLCSGGQGEAATPATSPAPASPQG
ncbi:MAG: hypothetical protein GX442_24965 [Candidatus Riflebacteria bacterium]|nr:hypothetical protein [Candidatus Riflebacteria bacterium]